MHEKIIASVALNNSDYVSLEAKLMEAVRWVDFAAKQGAELVVLPEALNLFRGDGRADLSFREMALRDWRKQTDPLFECARRNRIALTVPTINDEGSGTMVNCFHLVSREGDVLGCYEKRCPTPEEIRDGVRPGRRGNLIDWDGIRIGGAICFDCYFPEVFTQQADEGAQIFLMPSLTPGGAHLSYYAMRLGVPIAMAYPALSRIIDLDGRDISSAGYRHETLRFGFGAPVAFATLNFDRAVLFASGNQEKIVGLQEKYGPAISVKFDQDNCTFILESRDPKLAIESLIDQHALVPQRKYFRECGLEISRASSVVR
jgi:predicted amidohydrolase